MAGGLAGSVVSRLPCFVDTRDGRILTDLCAGCASSQVHCAGVPISDIVLWGSQCHRERIDHA